ncbi:phosphatase PAP2 family protein [Geomonas sp. RF6]|uniref:phosphatase PAP2 family protein n=1 Tax=Geomonas sp. RF6 TaxID=2897342 RepID=UPI001E3964A2|nr:phosphatase PAP2 family protein [Geomonas sp. RF6]UFS70513.1 phosphatase PAP2 family protein [Geomonas sp. RF6]
MRILIFTLLFVLNCTVSAPAEDSGSPLAGVDLGKEACYQEPPHPAQACMDVAAVSASPIADVAEKRAAGPNAAATAPPPAGHGAWKWRRSTLWEKAIAVGAIGSSLYLETIDPDTPKWSSRNDFDEGVRNALRLGGDADDRRWVYNASDVIMAIMIAAPEIDAAVTLGYRDRDWDGLYETLLMDLESFTFTSFVSVLLQTQIARERPFGRNCKDGQCESEEVNRSMPSGHAAYAFTSAGLLCTHHHYQNSYGNRETEGAVCATALGVASLEGILRIVADGHYATDVLAGTAIGLFSGFLLPRLLHYWHPEAQSDAKEAGKVTRLVVAPTLLPGNGAGLACSFRF